MRNSLVALFTRAWIEILGFPIACCVAMVALFTRAWIEIEIIIRSMFIILLSPSSRGRGLKLTLFFVLFKSVKSPSSRGRGLKSKSQGFLNPNILVALFTRAWIEIFCTRILYLLLFVALFTRAWIEINFSNYKPSGKPSPSSRGRGLKLYLPYIGFVKIDGRPLHEGVD